MKKCKVVFIALLIASSSFAQVSIDARVGGNLSGISESGLTMKFGAKAGLGIDCSLSELFALKSGLYFSMKGASDAHTSFDFFPENTMNLNYLEVPILASFRFQVAPKFAIAINGGPSISFLMNKKQSGSAVMSSTDVGANMGLDFVFNNKYVIAVESQYGLSELTKDSKQHIINYSLMFGYKF